MRFADVQLSFSTMMVAIIVSAIFKASFGSDFYAQYAVVMLVVIIGVAEWPQYARTIRASVLAEKKKEYVEAARVMGFKSLNSFSQKRIVCVFKVPFFLLTRSSILATSPIDL